MDLSALCVYTGYYFMYIGTLITFLFRRAAARKITHDNFMTKPWYSECRWQFFLIN